MKKIKTGLRRIILTVIFCILILNLSSSVMAASPTVATIGKTKYTTIQKAVDSVKKGQTIKLQRSITINTPIIVNRNVQFTLDFNKCSVKCANGLDGLNSSEDVLYAMRIIKGNVILKNGSVSNGVVETRYGARLTIRGGTYWMVDNFGTALINDARIINTRYSSIINEGMGKLIINKVSAKSIMNCVWIRGGNASIANGSFQKVSHSGRAYPVIMVEKGNLTIHSGTFCSLSGNALCLNETKSNVVVKGGTFTSNGKREKGTVYAVDVEHGKLTINGGKFIGYTGGSLFNAGTTTINGGHFNATGGKIIGHDSMDFKEASAWTVENQGILTINKGEILRPKALVSNKSGIPLACLPGSSTVINGGTIRNKGDYVSVFIDKNVKKFVLKGGLVQNDSPNFVAIYCPGGKSKKVSIAISHVKSNSGGKVEAKSTSMQTWASAYLKVAKVYNNEDLKNKSKSSSLYNPYRYSLIYFDEDNIPEFVINEPGYWISMYTYDIKAKKEVLVMDHWGYGAMGNFGYEYLPRKNVLYNENHDFAGCIVNYNINILKNNKLVRKYRKRLTAEHYIDKNKNGYPDENEYTLSARYYYGDKKISEKEFNSYIPKGTYEYMKGESTFSQINKKLKAQGI